MTPASETMPSVLPHFPPLETLNPPQREAVLATEGPVLVLAGAGTGKTRVLTTRLAYILQAHGVHPSRILAVTFTNKAASEMRSRIQALAGNNLEGFWLGTFHALCVRMLRRHAEKLSYTPDFTIIDTDDQLRMIKQILQAENLDDKSFAPRLVAGVISRWKDQVLSPEDVATQKTYGKDKVLAHIYRIYQERLKSLNSMDFGDLLFQALVLFRGFPDVLAWYQENFRYILVDEYQDTNTAQYLWLRLLAQKSKNICCVGDDDQSIYGWRGAEVKNILQFEQDFPGAKVIRLEQNYRSTPHILAAAAGLIAHNDGRLGKTLWTETAEGEPITLNTLWNGEEEASWIVEQIEHHHRKKTNLSTMAILVRAGFQTREFEERLLIVGVPYKVIGGLRFYERAEIRDALAYLRLVHNPADSLALERIINVPKRGIGAVAMNQLHEISRSQSISLLDAGRYAVEAVLFKGKTRLSMMDFLTKFDAWRIYSTTLPQGDLAKLILDDSGYTAMLKEEKTEQSQGRLDNLKELTNAMADYPTLGAFLEHVSLVMDTMSAHEDDMVTLMTLHSAKGLEFEVVFLPGWEEGIFPSQRTIQETGQLGLEEERRLAYVGLTRARRKAYVTCAKNRQVYGKWQPCVPSRFIAEIPARHVEEAGTHSHRGGDAYALQDPYQDRYQDRHQGGGRSSLFKKSQATYEPVMLTPSKSGSKAASRGPVLGTKVTHATHGDGTILAVDGDKADVFFPKAGRRKILLSFLELAE